MGFLDRLTNAWNAFVKNDKEERLYFKDYGYGSTLRPDRPRLNRTNEKSIVNTVYNRIALDCAKKPIKHVLVDEKDNFLKTISSTLNTRLTLEANKDQQSFDFLRDVILSMFDEGTIAVVPVDYDDNIKDRPGAVDYFSFRTGKIIEWFPDHVKVNVYNDRKGIKEDLILEKSKVAIIENPFYSLMNEPNSTLHRLIRKLNILDAIDEQSGSGKLDLIIQLPYVVKTDARRDQADKRRADLERQLTGSKYGVAYTDGTEKITQLNRPIENNLLKQIDYLTSMFYNQVGISISILDGTADEKTVINYTKNTLEPILKAIVGEFTRKFVHQIEENAEGKREVVMFFNDPFGLTPVSKLADFADKFTRNAILSSNEMRQIIGFPPVDDPAASALSNKNINQPVEEEKSDKSISDDPDTE